MADTQQSGSPSSGQSGQGQGSGAKPQLSWGQQAASSTKERAAGAGANAASTPSSRLIGTFVAGLIIGLLIAWAWFDLRSGTTESGTSTMGTSSSEFTITKTGNGASAVSQEETETAPTVSGFAISVPSTQPAGAGVEVSSISADGVVWAVVYANPDRSGGAMGAARFAERRSGVIELVYPTVAGKTYYVGLVSDTPSRTYSTKENKPILGSDGKQVMTQFTAQ